MREVATWHIYEFEVCEVAELELESGGLYVFAGRVEDQNGSSVWRAYYIGRTNKLWHRVAFHEKWHEAKARGATHVHYIVEHREQIRMELEEELIGIYQPSLNTYMR